MSRNPEIFRTLLWCPNCKYCHRFKTVSNCWINSVHKITKLVKISNNYTFIYYKGQTYEIGMRSPNSAVWRGNHTERERALGPCTNLSPCPRKSQPNLVPSLKDNWLTKIPHQIIFSKRKVFWYLGMYKCTPTHRHFSLEEINIDKYSL